jgi:hypothetical protein
MDAFSLLMPRARLNVLLSFVQEDEGAPELVQVPAVVDRVSISALSPEQSLDPSAVHATTPTTDHQRSNRREVLNILRQHQLRGWLVVCRVCVVGVWWMCGGCSDLVLVGGCWVFLLV